MIGRRLSMLLVMGALAAGCSDDGSPVDVTDAAGDGADAGFADLGDAASDAQNDAQSDADSGTAELRAIAGESVYARVGEEVVLDASASTGAVAYTWSFGDGEERPESADPVARHSYDAIGRYQAVLTVWGDDGARRTASVLVTVTPEPIHAPMASSTITVVPGRQRVAVVSPDSDELTIVRFRDDQFELVRRLPTDARPRTVTTFGEWLVVACQDSGTVLFERQDDSGEARRVFLPRGSQPYGVISTDGAVFVTLAATGEVARIEMPDGVPQVVSTVAVVDDGRHLAVLPDGRIAVSAWRSDSAGAELAIVDPALTNVERWNVATDPTLASDTTIGGTPNYLGPLAVSPAADASVLPFLHANTEQGLGLNGESLDQDKAVRAVLAFVDPSDGTERYQDRKQYDDRGHAAFALHTRFGDYVWVSMPSNRLVERYDLYGASEAGTVLDVGYAPQGIALSPNDRFLFVDAYLSRELVVYDVANLRGGAQEPVARFAIPSEEPLAGAVLRGKQLFNDARDQRLTAAGYLSCSNCHMDGLDDRQTWDFTGRGEGLRNTIALVGRGGTVDGPIHWSGNFDEIQDFENDIREHFGGSGLMTDADWASGTTSDPLGEPKAGASAELDALAAYVESLAEHPESPLLVAGELSAEAAAGKVLFESAQTGCASCHSGSNLTDSQWLMPGVPLLHDVGTLSALSGQRLGGPLEGIDTPTLRGLWNSRPYLHDGSAATLTEVLADRNPDDLHGTTSGLTPTELAQLEAYLLSL